MLPSPSKTHAVSRRRLLGALAATGTAYLLLTLGAAWCGERAAPHAGHSVEEASGDVIL